MLIFRHAKNEANHRCNTRQKKSRRAFARHADKMPFLKYLSLCQYLLDEIDFTRSNIGDMNDSSPLTGSDSRASRSVAEPDS
jgi:hypothetical protein